MRAKTMAYIISCFLDRRWNGKVLVLGAILYL
jgi:hypothetical protein